MSTSMKTRKKQRKVVFFIITALLLTVTAAALIFSQYTGEGPTVYPDVEGIDPSAYDMELSLLNRALGIKKNSEDTFSYKIKKKIDVSDNRAPAKITNPVENNCLMAVEMTLDGDDDVIYRSGYIKPNQRIDEIEFSKSLKSGEYEICVYFCAVDFDSLELLGILEEKVPMTVS